MLFMLIVKASKHSEMGDLPSEVLRKKMSAYNEQLVSAGVRVLAKGLHPSSNGIRIAFPVEDGQPVITTGPFEAPGEIVAGFIIIDVKDKDEAIKWALKMPDPQGFGEGQIEVRQIFE